MAHQETIYHFPKTNPRSGISHASDSFINTPLIGSHPEIERIRRLIDRVSGTGLNVLISGESGVGKEVVASNLYAKSPRLGKPFIKVNCAAFPEGLLESELFGYEVGAFTGAVRKKRGKFELANGGVLLLDEIGDMPLSLQSKLLLVLQSGEVTPLGSEKTIKTDCWIICLTNHNLMDDIKQKRFREDLYYRINTIDISIPPLRSRREDIKPILDYYWGKYTRGINNIQRSMPSEIMEKLSKYDWPGNIRELQNTLQRFLVMEDLDKGLDILATHNSQEGHSAPNIKAFDIEKLFVENLMKSTPSLKNGNSYSLKILKNNALCQVEKQVISMVLEKTRWNRTKASQLLKISYKSLLNKIKELQLAEANMAADLPFEDTFRA